MKKWITPAGTCHIVGRWAGRWAVLGTALCLHSGAYATEVIMQSQLLNVDKYQFTVQIDSSLKVEPLAVGLNSPRLLHFHGDRLFIGSRSGEVYWLDPPYTQPQLLTVISGYPHSVVIRDQQIYIARTANIVVAPYNPEQPAVPADNFRQWVKLPGGRGHSSRSLKLGPDNQFYVSLGIAGNCSDQYLDSSYPFKDQRGGLFLIDESGDQPLLTPYAAGLRNPVGFDWTPDGSAIYASNNGPDHLGYLQPPEQFVRITKGSFHGMPWYQYDGANFFRDRCIDTEPPLPQSALSAPEALFPARNAPLDVAFIHNTAETNYAGDAVVALHGSWATADAERGAGDPAQRREPALVRVVFKHGHATEVVGLLRGFQLPDGQRWGRPAGVAVGPDGAIYFTSDDGIEGLYRLRWIKPDS